MAQKPRPAQKPAFTPKIGDVIRETQKLTQDSDGMTLVWWVPTEFWVLSMRQRGPGAGVTEAQIQEFKGAVQKYAIVAVMCGKIGCQMF